MIMRILVKTVTKALSLLSQFSQPTASRSLGVIADEAGLDKATARRMLVSMRDLGFVEQDPKTREYSLGAAVLPLARAREAHRPLQAVAARIVHKLAQQTGETAHFSVPSANGLSVLRVVQGPQPIRVHIAEGDILPFHTSGAGIAFLSASASGFFDRVLSEPLSGFARNSYTKKDRVLEAINDAKTSGYALTAQTLEDNVCGIGVPVLQSDSRVVGSLAVATPLSRMNETSQDLIVTCLRSASQEMMSMI